MQKLIRVNSKFKASGNNGSFEMKFEVRDLDTVKGIAVVRASLNRNFPNIYSPINILSYQPNVGAQINLVIPPLQYTATTLAAAIQTASAGDFTVTYSPFPVDRFIFTYNNGVSASAQLLASSSLAPYIGLTSNILFPAVATPETLQSPPALAGPDSVYIQSQFISGSNCIETTFNGNYIPYLCALDFTNIPYGFSSYFEAKTPEVFTVNFSRQSGVRSCAVFDIQITDVYGNILPIPDNDYLDMHMVFYY